MNHFPIPTGQLPLSGPSEKLDGAHWPVRGDLAHIRLAGRCFVPHYAVPMVLGVRAGGAVLRRAANAQSEPLGELAAHQTFDVLDIVGDWCWGESGVGGLVGYVPAAQLEMQQ